MTMCGSNIPSKSKMWPLYILWASQYRSLNILVGISGAITQSHVQFAKSDATVGVGHPQVSNLRPSTVPAWPSTPDLPQLPNSKFTDFILPPLNSK